MRAEQSLIDGKGNGDRPFWSGWSAIRNVWSAALLQAKNEDRVKVYANVSGLGGVMDSGHAMEMRCALVLISLAASEGVFRISGFKSAGSTVVPSHLSPADLAITKSHIS